jgi:aryl-alcohol dehydrogenase-like predicted oxidoreductase
MEYRTLGRTGISVSVIGFGAWAIGGNKFGNSYGATNDRESAKAIAKAIEMGCNFFDTADAYGHGHSEEILGAAFKGKRDKIIIASKVGGDFYKSPTRMNFDPEYITFALEKSLKRLDTDYIDLYQLHNPPLHMIRQGEIFDIMGKLKLQGKIRAIGISIFEPVEGVETIKNEMSDCIQVVYNVLNRQAAKDLFPLARERNIGIIAREPLSNGILTGKFNGFEIFETGDVRKPWPKEYFQHLVSFSHDLKNLLEDENRSMAQAALQFVLSQPAVSTVIPGMKTEIQVEENLNTVNLGGMKEGELTRIIQFLLQK